MKNDIFCFSKLFTYNEIFLKIISLTLLFSSFWFLLGKGLGCKANGLAHTVSPLANVAASNLRQKYVALQYGELG